MSEIFAVVELRRDLDEAANFKENRLEQLILLFCKQTKICYNSLIEEKHWLTQIVRKSELMNSYVLQCGKKK